MCCDNDCNRDSRGKLGKGYRDVLNIKYESTWKVSQNKKGIKYNGILTTLSPKSHDETEME